MVNCAECQLPTQRGNKETIICSLCKNIFHSNCGGLSATDVTFLREQNKFKAWKCKKCTKKLRTETRSDSTPIKIDISEEKTVSDTGNETTNQQNNFRSSPDYDALMVKINELLESNNFLAQQQQEATTKLTEATNEIKTLNKRITELQNEIIAKDKRIILLEVRVNKMEQNELATKVEITGLKLQDNDKLGEMVEDLFTNIKLEVKNEIVKVYTRRRRESTNPNIVVEFRSKQAAEESLRKRGKHTFRNNIVYLNECLTAYNRNLLWLTKNKAKEANFKYTWIRDGKILCRKTEGDKIIYIKSEQDLIFLD